MDYENILVEHVDGSVGLIRLNRPKALNALNATLMTEMAAALVALDNDPAVGCVVIAGRLGLLVAVLVLGAIPFCALGLVIGLMFDSQTAQVAQMITLLVLAFLGGIFISWNSLPHGMQMIGKVLPSYHLAQLGWNAAAGRGLGMMNIAVLAAWTAGLAALALWRWRSESTAA